ncbi:ABC transporter substrate-binding protein [Frondihabitans sucicola]
MRSRMQRRIAAITATAAALTLLATGCSGSSNGGGDQPALSKDKVTISLNWWGNPARNSNTTKAIALFEKKYPNITVDQSNTDWSGYWDKLATSTAASEMPDVNQFDQLYVASYAQRGALLDLSTVSNTLKSSALPKSVVGTGEVGGKLYAMPVGVTPNGVIINRAALKKEGIAMPDTDTWTWKQFDDLATEVTQKSGGSVHGLGPFGSDSFSLGIWARQHGNNVFDSAGKVTLKPSVLTSYWQQELDWIADKASPSASHIAEGASFTLEQNDLSTGKTAMGFIPAGQFTAYNAANPDADFTMANWPSGSSTDSGFQYPKPSMYWAISSKSEHPAEAALLVNFLLTNKDAGKILGVERGVPSNPAIQTAITPQLSTADKFSLDFTAAMVKKSGKAPAITPNGASDIETMMARYNQQVIFGQKTPKAAAAAFIKELQDNITNAG